MLDGVLNTVKGGVRSFFEYDTPKIVHIKSLKVGLMNRLIQLVILGYVVGYAIVYEKGYQEFDEVVSACSSKVKGVTYTNISTNDSETYTRLWDVADYVIPPQENNAFFVMTNAIITQNQTQGTCPEDPSKRDAICTSNDDCQAGQPVVTGNGVKTGNCTVQDRSANKTCEIYAWCPTEWDDKFPSKEPLLKGSEDYTVLLKNQIEFPKFNFQSRNVPEFDKEYLDKCRYNPYDAKDKYCPIFRLGDIVSLAGGDYETLAYYGGFISINIAWDCDLDKDASQCRPKYTFRRLDDKDSNVARGWNFRYANYYYEEGVQYRDLIKAYGIRFIINVHGTAGKFSFIPLVLNLGSGLALLAIATVISDVITLYVLKKGTFYKERKYLYVDEPDAQQAIFDENYPEPKPTENATAPTTQDKLLSASTERKSYDAVGTTNNIQGANQEGGETGNTGSRNVRQRPGEYNRLEEED